MGYGGGSGQQIVTCHRNRDEVGGLWAIKEGDYTDDNEVEQSDKMCKTGEPIKCNDLIRLEHVETGKNLHSHDVRSPIS